MLTETPVVDDYPQTSCGANSTKVRAASMNTNDKSVLRKFLAHHKVCRTGNDARFFLTPPSSAITVYRQQIRALNLALAIHECWDDEPSLARSSRSGARVAVLGGGIAGITVAAGLVRQGFNVHLFEQRPELCHLQAGCETRWLHPHIYEWPDPKSHILDARLPLLNWSAATAGDVVKQILRQFDNIKGGPKGICHIYLRASAKSQGMNVTWDNADIDNASNLPGWLGRGGAQLFDVVIFAVGFGIERGVTDRSVSSYWRNDQYGQSQPGGRSEKSDVVLVSGVGDGGLIDLIRVCLQGFKHGDLVEDLFGGCTTLVQWLREKREEHVNSLRAGIQHNLQAAFMALEREGNGSALGNEFLTFRTRLKNRLRTNTVTVLNGEESSFSQILIATKRSFLNIFLAHNLYQLEAFSYIGGKCGLSTKHRVADIDEYGKVHFDAAIVRHGTDREKTFKEVGLGQSEIDDISKSNNALDEAPVERLWSPGWWDKLLHDAPTEQTWRERLPRTEQAISSVVTGCYCEMVKRLPMMNGCRYRTTMHRTLRYVRSDGPLYCYQQLTPYFGNAVAKGELPNRLEGKEGRVFPTEPSELKSGLVGLTIQTGLAFFAQLSKEAEDEKMPTWMDLWAKLVPSNVQNGEIRYRAMDPKRVTTVATVPILAKTSDAKYVVRYVIYLDIEHGADGSRPSQGDVSAATWAIASGMVESISALRKCKVDDQSFFASSTAVPNVEFMEVPSPQAAIPPTLGKLGWATKDFAELVRIERCPADCQILDTTEEFELRCPL